MDRPEATGDVEVARDAGEEMNPADLLTAALEAPEVSAEELQAVDARLDAMMLNEAVSGLNGGKSLLSLEEAQAKLSPEILDVLADKFKGSPVKVRHIDERDQLF